MHAAFLGRSWLTLVVPAPLSLQKPPSWDRTRWASSTAASSASFRVPARPVSRNRALIWSSANNLQSSKKSLSSNTQVDTTTLTDFVCTLTQRSCFRHKPSCLFF